METGTFGLLGPVEVRVPGRPPAALPPSVRVLLARLALSAGRVVSTDALTDALWGEDLPADAANALQLRVSKLRRALVAAGVPADVLLTVPEAATAAGRPGIAEGARHRRAASSGRDPGAAFADQVADDDGQDDEREQGESPVPDVLLEPVVGVPREEARDGHGRRSWNLPTGHRR